MKEITNKHLLITMIIIGVITIALLIPLQNSKPTQYSYNNIDGSSLGATAYNSDYSGSQSTSIFGLSKNRYPYVPVITRTYTTPDTTYTEPSDIYYSTQDSSLDDSYYYNQGDVPAGCESGVDYSLTTGEPCG